MKTRTTQGPRWTQAAALLLIAVAAILLPACTKHTVKIEPIEVKPIHMTMDINIRIDRQLDNFFDYEKELGGTGGPTTQPQGGT